MLPVYIIDEILKREWERDSFVEIYIERPEMEESWTRLPDEKSEEKSEERGVVIIDYTV